MPDESFSQLPPDLWLATNRILIANQRIEQLVEILRCIRNQNRLERRKADFVGAPGSEFLKTGPIAILAELLKQPRTERGLQESRWGLDCLPKSRSTRD
jgi:hypothetical protein